MQAGNLIANIQNSSNKKSVDQLEKTSHFENTLITVDFDNIDPEDVKLTHDKSNLDEEKVLVFWEISNQLLSATILATWFLTQTRPVNV